MQCVSPCVSPPIRQLQYYTTAGVMVFQSPANNEGLALAFEGVSDMVSPSPDTKSFVLSNVPPGKYAGRCVLRMQHMWLGMNWRAAGSCRWGVPGPPCRWGVPGVAAQCLAACLDFLQL